MDSSSGARNQDEKLINQQRVTDKAGGKVCQYQIE